MSNTEHWREERREERGGGGGEGDMKGSGKKREALAKQADTSPWRARWKQGGLKVFF